jgi:hypothetical protein
VKVFLGAGDLAVKRDEITGGTHAPAGWVTGSGREREVPAEVAEIEGAV